MEEHDVHEWTNMARYPSRLDDRDIHDARKVIAKTGVPDCAVLPMAVKVKYREGNTVVMTHHGGFAKYVSFDPKMVMTYAKEGKDLAVPKTVVADGTIAEGRHHRVVCDDGTVVDGAYWPKCGNFSYLEENPDVELWPGHDSSYPYPYLVPLVPFVGGGTGGTTRGGGGDTPTGQVPVPPTFPLLLLGLLLLWIVLRKK